MKRINKNIGARVQVHEVLVAINPKDKWKVLKNVKGVIVEDKGYEHYYHTSNGDNTKVYKHLIKSDTYKTFAVKLDNGVTDIEGNNIIVKRELFLKFLDRIEVKPKPVSKKAYLNAKKIVERYESEHKCDEVSPDMLSEFMAVSSKVGVGRIIKGHAK